MVYSITAEVFRLCKKNART